MRLIAVYLAGILLAAPASQSDRPQQLPDSNGAFVAGQGVLAPRLTHAASAACPPGAEHARRVVALTLVVKPDGTAGDVTLMRATHSPLDEAAIAAVRQSTFSAGMRDGRAVPVLHDVYAVFAGDGDPGRLIEKLDHPPVPIATPEAEFSDEARRKGVQGELMLNALVDEEGRVADVRLVSRLGAGLDEQAVKAVRQYQFRPAMEQGEAVPVHVTVAVNFRLFHRREPEA